MVGKWDTRFIELAQHVATWSKDSTKVGAVITNGKRIISLGFNGFPAGTDDSEDLYENRARKLHRVLHAEENAILFARQDLAGCTIYVNYTPCGNCAAKIVQSGIIRVVTYPPDPKFLGKWGESVKEALAMFEEAGVEYVTID